MVEKIVDALTERIDRRSFVGSTVKAMTVLALSIIGVPRVNALVDYKCCHLCANHDPTCTGNCSWSWTCCYTTEHFNYSCAEYYDPCTNTSCPTPQPACADTDASFRCSKATKLSTAC